VGDFKNMSCDREEKELRRIYELREVLNLKFQTFRDITYGTFPFISRSIQFTVAKSSDYTRQNIYVRKMENSSSRS
jgi:hypothetical protein